MSFGPSIQNPIGSVPWTIGNVALPFDFGSRTYFAEILVVSGVTQDAVGNAVGSATVRAFQTGTDIEVALTTSDGSGNFTFLANRNQGQLYLKADKAGAPNIQGVTDNFQPI